MTCAGWKSFPILSAVTLLALGLARTASGDVFSMPSGDTSVLLVTVGDINNAPDTNGYGSVSYQYEIGKFDITTAQYAAFLNSVAKTDQYGLYDIEMSPTSNFASCGIIQSGSAGSYTYSFPSSNANFPVNEVSFGDALRFANWLSNGQPATGIENAGTTEDGSYAVNGAMTDQQLDAVTRSPTATYVVPNENEWYKASYYKSGSTNAGYWLYPTQSDSPPSNVLSMTGTNNANFNDPIVGLTDPINGLTAVGAFAGSPGPYGTYDIGGDVSQWNETIVGSERAYQGGSFAAPVSYLASSSPWF
jgi:formylglycine-generating enzyme